MDNFHKWEKSANSHVAENLYVIYYIRLGPFVDNPFY